VPAGSVALAPVQGSFFVSVSKSFTLSPPRSLFSPSFSFSPLLLLLSSPLTDSSFHLYLNKKKRQQTLLLENTKARKFNEREETKNAAITPRQRAALSEHFLVIVQYHSARGFDAERLKKELLARADGVAPAKAFNLRLAKDGAAEALTGFAHGAVTPVGALCGLLGSKGQVASRGHGRGEGEGAGAGGGAGGGEGGGAREERVPVVLSSRVARLPEFWMGGGEVDLKLCISTRDFVGAYDPIVAGVMHGDEEEEKEDR